MTTEPQDRQREFHVQIMHEFIADVLISQLKLNNMLPVPPLDFAAWKASVDWPLPASAVNYRVLQGISRLGSAILLFIHKGGVTLSGYESTLIHSGFTRSLVPGQIFKLMPMSTAFPLDSHQTFGLLLYQASSTSVIGPASYQPWTIINSWVAENFDGVTRKVVAKARDLARARDVINQSLPDVFVDLNAFWTANPQSIDTQNSDTHAQDEGSQPKVDEARPQVEEGYEDQYESEDMVISS
ncbi:hypothetical protein B0H17DRAFT_1207394 [Mycena rosella]|uniref:Uncharacterized protein n=1 Tax=Mycena rosella TaxID=1033263 RepID=A0AAD7D3B2_MYCRO|nr:hypothetical protein B0H17DRAFT_1207394 [Mycena rosella]